MFEPYTEFTAEIAALHRRELRADAEKYRLLKQCRPPRMSLRCQLCLRVGSWLIDIGTRLQEPVQRSAQRPA